MSISFLVSFDASLMVVYSDGVRVVPKVKNRQRKASFPTIAMHAGAICMFSWMYIYAASFFTNQDAFEGYLRVMATIMWVILRIQKP